MADSKLNVEGTKIRTYKEDENFISLTDICKNNSKDDPSSVIARWLRNRSTIAFMAAWEETFNDEFNSAQMSKFKEFADDNRMLITTKRYIEISGAQGIISKAGKYGGTYAHKDIALEFCSWLSPRFKVAMIKTFRILMEKEAERKNFDWHIEKITNNIDEVRNLLDTIPGQKPNLNRLNSVSLDED